MHRPTCEEGLVLLFSSDFQHEENQCSPDPVNCNKRMSQTIIRNSKRIDQLSHSKQYKTSVLRASLDTKVAWSKSRWQLVITAPWAAVYRLAGHMNSHHKTPS